MRLYLEHAGARDTASVRLEGLMGGGQVGGVWLIYSAGPGREQCQPRWAGRRPRSGLGWVWAGLGCGMDNAEQWHSQQAYPHADLDMSLLHQMSIHDDANTDEASQIHHVCTM